MLAEQAMSGLSTQVVHALHDVSRSSAFSTVARTGRRVVQRHPGVADYDSYLRLAARRIDDILSTGGLRPLFYVFGHSHVAGLEELAARGAWYANTGTWSHRHHLRGDNKNSRQFPFVVTSTSLAGRQVALRHWDADTSEVVCSTTPVGDCRRLPTWEGIAVEEPASIAGFRLSAQRVGSAHWGRGPSRRRSPATTSMMRLPISQGLSLGPGPQREHVALAV